MDIELYDPPASPPHVPVAAVNAALDDARAVAPAHVHRTIALAVTHGSEKTARLRLERLARVVMATDIRITDPALVWAADWSAMPVEALEAMDRAIRAAWSSVSTRNAMRDAVRAVIRESLSAGILTHDRATPLLMAVRPEKPTRDAGKQARGHLPAARVQQVFHEIAQDSSPTARRDAALLALLLGAGLRRGEAAGLDLAHLDARHESVVVRGKGDAIRDVPLSPSVRRAVQAWIDVRGSAPGPLLTPLTPAKPRQAVLTRRLSTNTVAQVVSRRFGEDVRPHDLRRTFTGDLLDAGVDLSIVSTLLGHVSPATTARYDRRGGAVRQAAVERFGLAVEVTPSR